MGEGNRNGFWYDPWSGHLPLRELTLIYMLVLFLKKLWYVLVSSQDGRVGAGIYELFRIGSWKMCILSLSFFIPNCLVGREMID